MNTTVAVHRVTSIEVEPVQTFSSAYCLTITVRTADGKMEIALFSEDLSALEILKESQE